MSEKLAIKGAVIAFPDGSGRMRDFVDLFKALGPLPLPPPEFVAVVRGTPLLLRAEQLEPRCWPAAGTIAPEPYGALLLDVLTECPDCGEIYHPARLVLLRCELKDHAGRPVFWDGYAAGTVVS